MPPPRPPAPMRDVLADGRSDDHLAGLFTGDEVDDSALSGEDSARGKVTAVVNPAPRAVSMRRSVAEISSAILTQLVVWGRSSGPRAGRRGGLGDG